MELMETVARRLQVQRAQVQAVMTLLEEGSTVPFIARYRKERTKGLDEEAIRQIQEMVHAQQKLEQRKADVLRLIDQQGKLDEEIKAAVEACEKLSQVEDLYRPYQQKRKTRAGVAIARGLQPLAEHILSHGDASDLMTQAQRYVGDEVSDAQAAVQGAQDIIAEMVSDDAKVRGLIRTEMERFGTIVTKEKKDHGDERHVYAMYYAYSEKVNRMQPHRIMAIERAEREKVITVSIEIDEARIAERALRMYAKGHGSMRAIISDAVKDGLTRLAFPAVEREVRRTLYAHAQESSIDVFSMNVERLLSQPPLRDKWILGFDPAFRTGCKLAVVDPTGRMCEVSVIYPHPPKAKVKEAQEELCRLVRKYGIDVIAIGNGTASRESEAFVAEVIRTHQLHASFTLVSEAGASIYSASPLAKEEFPHLQVEQRSAVSIARRIIDPLAELIKIDPQSLGVGQYQHDLSQTRLKERLDFAVSKVVNRVGVDINTASAQLLRHVSGLNAVSARNIVAYREEHGSIRSRREIKKVPRIGERSYEQAAGFLRVRDGEERMDATAIHPESYALARQVLTQMGLAETDMGTAAAREKAAQADARQLSEALGSDPYTIQDILDAIAAPARDYRDRYPQALLKSGVLELSDLHEGEELQGTVRNVVDFGAFVDIGLHEDGLVHISKMSKKRIRHPGELVSVGDIVTVWVCHIDEERGKVQLSLLPPREERT